VPKTLLAVDDSATMRKVLEITFGGEDFRVITAEGSQRAVTLLNEEPVAVVIDTSLDGDPYALTREIRARDPRTAIVLMGSRYNPYDGARGKEAGADDSIDKPFDTQALIDKVKKAMLTREASAPAIAPPPPAPVFQAPQQPPHAAQALAAPLSTAPRPAPVITPAVRPGGFAPPQRSTTLSFEGGAPAAPPPPAPVIVPVAAPPVVRTAPSGIPAYQPAAPPAANPPAVSTLTPGHQPPTPSPVSPVATSTSPVAASVNGQLAGKLGELGLSPAQVEAVLSLSREVVERVVWEVVPQLAETIIKEELARLTRD
jgi:CheY-like chemotaxis protein